MGKSLLTIVAVVVASAWMCGSGLAANSGTTKPPTVGSTQPHLGNGPAEEKSLPSSAPPATTTAQTGATNQNSTVKSMNKDAKTKIDVEGK
jgi:hypothetical protein